MALENPNEKKAVLRALDSTPELSSEMPLWGSSATKRTWQADGGTRCERRRAMELTWKWHYDSYPLVMIGLAMIMVYDTTIVDGIYNPIYPLVIWYIAIENGYL